MKKSLSSEQTSPIVYLQVRRSTIAALLAILLLPWILVTGLYLSSRNVQSTQVQRLPEPAANSLKKCRAGPWGELEYYKIVLQPPDEYISIPAYEKSGTTWIFHDVNKDKISELLGSAGLQDPERNALLSTFESFGPGACQLKPTDELLLSLNPQVRARIYAMLSRTSDNLAQSDPFVTNESQFEDWFAKGQIASSTLSILKKLTYIQNGPALLADYGVVLRHISDPAEKARFLKNLLGRPSLILKLTVTTETNINALVEYWGKAGCEKDIRPLLESLPKTSEGVTINPAQLFPVFARDRIYTFPLPSNNPVAQHRDCHWSSLNFFGDALPDDRFTTENQVVSTLQAEYFPTAGNPAFGDVALFVNADGKLIHSAIYIADDILFTKNGGGPTSPWILMCLADLRTTFYSNPPTYYRRKKL